MPHNSFGCILPTASELQTLQVEIFPRFLEGRLGLDILPFKTTDMPSILLRQPDLFKGLQAFRGLGKPTLAIPERYNPYGTFCYIQPGYWGEHDVIEEELLTKGAAPGSCNEIIDLSEVVTLLQQRLLERRANRIEYNIWQTLTFGRYTALNSAGQVIFEEVFNIRNVSAAIPWTNFAGSFPLRDFRAIQLLGPASGVDFGACARYIMSRETANLLFSNINPQDVGRVGLSACCVFMSPEQINQQFAAQGLGQIVIYDQGYVDDNGSFNRFIPFGYVIIVGCRPGGVPIGHYWLTRNAAGCDITSGFWQKLVDSCDRSVPREIKLYDVGAGGPILEYPRAVIVLKVA